MKKIYSLLLILIASFSSQAQDVVISQFFGGNSATNPYNQDFVEVFNKSAAPVDVSGWSVQYGAAGATSNINVAYTFPASTIIAPGKFYLVGLASSVGGTSIPTPDGTGTINMSGTNGKVALVKNNTALLLTVTNPINQTTFPNISDFVGYGTSNLFESAALTGVLATNIPKRNANGCTDSGNNSTDFTNVTSTTPRNSATPASVCSTDPTIAISSPANGTNFSPETTSVNVALSISNFIVGLPGAGIDGHIHYTINSVAQPMKYDTTPINVPVTPGTSYTVYVELVNNTHTPIVPAKNATVTFTIADYIPVSDLAELRTDVVTNGIGRYYHVLSMPVASYTRTTRNQKYVQDANGGILIDDSTGVLNGLAVVEADGIMGLKGQSVNFSNVLQLSPTTATGVTKMASTPIIPQNITIATYMVTPEDFESELIQFGPVTFTNRDVVVPSPYVFAANQNLNITDDGGVTTTVFRTGFAEANYITQNIPITASQLIAIGSDFTSSEQVLVRRLADMGTLGTNSFDAIAGLNVYPNPAKTILNITSNSFAAKTISVVDVLGKEVLSATTLNNEVNVSALAKGVYVLKVTEEGKTATRKLVIE